MTEVRLSQAQAHELRNIYAVPGWQFDGMDARYTRRALRTLGLAACEGKNDWSVTPAGLAWLEAHP
jgi:hypothetical protein